ncbi:organic cation transporter protein-like [Ornithodoros turicata]|uniref:organic cation transporter protein-like n=1 Tax=Ornithodoros turicata TaxID=34597 RepID=UPI003139898B
MLSGTDRCLLLLGSPGRFQWLMVFLLSLLQLHAVLNQLGPSAFAVVPKHRCLAHPNATLGESDIWPVETLRGKQTYSSCRLYKDPENHRAGTLACSHGWEYLVTERENNIVSEWDLVCDRSHLRDLLFYVSPACSVLGALAFSALSDRICRKMALVLAYILQTASSIALLFAPTYVLFVLVFALQAAFSSGTLVVSYVLLLEVLPTPFHLQGACALSLAWFLAHMVLAALVSLVNAWRYLQLSIAAPAIVCAAFLWLVPRSLPQVLLLNKKPLAEETLVKMAHFGRVVLPSSYRSLLQHVARTYQVPRVALSEKHNLGNLFLYKYIRRYLLTQLYLWFVVSLFLHIDASQIASLSERKAADFFVRGITCIGLVLLVYILSRRFGTVRVQTLLLAAGGVAYVVAAIFDHRRYTDDDTEAALSVVLPGLVTLLGWLMGTVAKGVMVFDVVKSMPTGTRAFGLSCCIAVGNGAEMIAPSLSTLGGLLPSFFAMAGCGVLVLTAAGLSLVYPEVWNKPLPQTFEAADDGKAVKGNKRSGSYSLPYGRYPGDFVFSSGDHPIETVLSLTNQCTGANTNTFCKRSGVTASQSHQVYPEKGSVYFQSTHASSTSQSYASQKQDTSCCSDGDDCDCGTECRISDLEEEINRAWKINMAEPGPSSALGPSAQQHDLRYFAKPERISAQGYSETTF